MPKPDRPTPYYKGAAAEENPKDDEPLDPGTIEAAKMVMSPEPPDTNLAPITDPAGRTELANAKRLIRRFGSDLCYVKEWGNWIVWDRHRWSRDLSGVSIQARASSVAEDLWDEVKYVNKKANWALKPVTTFVASSNTVKGIANMANLARPELAISITLLDTNHNLFNCSNGTIDLLTGILKDANPRDFITKICPHPYDPRARCPRWTRFLEEIFQGDSNKVGYLQRLLGYSLTGDVREQVLPVLWGGGSNGKSTLFNLLERLIGNDYYGSPPRELFKATHSDRHPTELMTLHGKRLMVTYELDAGTKLNEPLIKALTGGDPVTGRGVYENFVTFQPTHKLMLLTNHKPKVTGTDYAIWRRLKVLEMTAEFKDEDGTKDAGLGEKLLGEAPGILAWMVRGCLDWRESGLREPECVKLATDNYRQGEDDLGRFLEENCTKGNYTVLAGDLLDAYNKWNPDSPITHRAMSTRLKDMGFVAGHLTTGPKRNQRLWRGLCLSASALPPITRFKTLTNENN